MKELIEKTFAYFCAVCFCLAIGIGLRAMYELASILINHIL
jgi:hypothetical protein